MLTPVPAAVRDVHDADLVRDGAPASWRSRRSSTAPGTLATLRRIFLPAVRPGIVTVGLFAFLAAWNDFITPLILINDDNKSPLPLAIAIAAPADHRTRSTTAPPRPGSWSMAVPCLLIFILLQRYYVSGFMSGAVKG